MSTNDNIYHFKNNNVRLHISNFVRDIISPFEKKYGKKTSELDELWKIALGNEFSDFVKPNKITKEYKYVNNERVMVRKLHLDVDNARALEITYNSEKIINKINKFYGTDFISQIIIKNKHQPNNTNNMSKISNQYKKSPSVKFRVSTDGIKDDSLRNALEKLGSNIKES
ncbi:MAG: DUF721 domain-containing protein [Alphaproteobacteria bacterium]|nr:DUF721 domain-containing protein [Alphaproteobacteria bacterium]